MTRMNVVTSTFGLHMSPRMFTITTRTDPTGHVMVAGKASRKQACFVNVPLCQATKARLEARVIGSLSMGTSALIEWALDELARQGIAIEARADSKGRTL